MKQGLHQFTQLQQRQRARAQKTVHLVMTRARQVRGQVRAGVVFGRAQQVLDVLGLSQHGSIVVIT